MSNKLIYSLIPVSTGGSEPVNVEGNYEVVKIKPATNITLTSAYNVIVSGTPSANTEITFIYGGNITSDTSTGKSVNIFGTELTNAQALYEGEIKAYYNGSTWEVKIFPDAESGLANLDGSALVTGSIATAAIADDAVTNDKLNSMTRGTLKIGGPSNAPTDLDAKTSGNLLIGDGTDIKSVAMSGDITINASGVTTIGAGKVTNAMLATPSQALTQLKVVITSAQLLALNTTPVEILAAPGSNKLWRITGGAAYLNWGTATYTSGGTVNFTIGGTTVATLASTIVTGASDSYGYITDATSIPLTTALNQPLKITCSTADFATGDGILTVILNYEALEF